MEKNEYLKHYELEEKFWWFAGRRKILVDIIESLEMSSEPRKFLDAGCGTGFNMKVFQRFGEISGCDISPEAINFCLKRGLKTIARAGVENLPFKDSSFDLVMFLDVLYHRQVGSDLKALSEADRVLKKGGYLLITDSAFNFLRSGHDIAFHTRERYTRHTLRKRLEKTGLSATKMSYFNFFLFFPVALARIWKKISSPGGQKALSSLKPINWRINAFFLLVLKMEAFLVRHINFPWGSSIFCLSRKR